MYWAVGVETENGWPNPRDLSKRSGLRRNWTCNNGPHGSDKEQTTPTTICCCSLKRFDWAAFVTEPYNQLNVVRCLPLFLFVFLCFSIVTLAAREKALGFEPQPGLIVLPKSLAPGYGAAVLELLTWLAQAVVLDASAPGRSE